MTTGCFSEHFLALTLSAPSDRLAICKVIFRPFSSQCIKSSLQSVEPESAFRGRLKRELKNRMEASAFIVSWSDGEKQWRKLSCLIDNWGRSFELLSWMGAKESRNIFHSSLSSITKQFSRDPETKTYKRRRETFEYMFYWISKFVSWKMMPKLRPNFLLAFRLGNLEELFAFNLIRVALDWNWQVCHSHSLQLK